MDEFRFIQDLAVLLVCGGVAGMVCARLRLSVTFGYMLTGLLAGPSLGLLPLAADPANLRVFAQLGLIFLMFSIGLNLGLRQIRRVGMPVLAATLLSGGLVFAATRGLGMGLGLGAVGGLFVAGMFIDTLENLHNH